MLDKITKRSVESVDPGASDVFLWDRELHGFGCKITPKGRRIYVLQYSKDGRDRRVTIGRHGVDLTAEQARKEAQRLRGVVAAGNDPAEERARERAAGTTVADLAERYIAEYAAPHKKSSGIAQDRRNIDNHIIPLIGRAVLSQIDKDDIARLMREISAGKTANDEKTKLRGRRIVAGGPVVANRVASLLSKMFALAEDWKLRPPGTNPCKGVRRYTERKIERYLGAEEMARLGAALAAAERGELMLNERVLPDVPVKRKRGGQPKAGQPRSENLAAIAAVRLLLLTGCRMGEILNLRWEHVDTDRRLLRLPDSKTGAKVIYLPEAAVQVLRAIEKQPEHPYVLPGRLPGRPLLTIRKPWRNLCVAAKLNDLRIHDLRHSFASMGAAGGLSLPMIGALLGHSQPSTTARYAHLAASPIHEAADAVGAAIATALGQDCSAVRAKPDNARK
jgi:integrase